MAQEPEHVEAGRPRRRRRRVAISSAALLAIVALVMAGGYWWLKAGAAVHHVGADSCPDVPVHAPALDGAEVEIRAEICAAIDELGRAWADHDADAYGAVFTDDATYVTFAGTYYSGREDIVRSHAALYDGPLEGTRLTDSFLELRILTDDVALLTTRGDTYDDEAPDQPSKVQTYTFVREDDAWRIAAFQNTQRKPVMEQVQFRMLPDTRPHAER